MYVDPVPSVAYDLLEAYTWCYEATRIRIVLCLCAMNCIYSRTIAMAMQLIVSSRKKIMYSSRKPPDNQLSTTRQKPSKESMPLHVSGSVRTILVSAVEKRVKELQTRTDEESQRELCAISMRLLQMDQSERLLYTHDQTATATEMLASLSQTRLKAKAMARDEAYTSAWAAQCTGALWVLFWAWFICEIYFRGASLGWGGIKKPPSAASWLAGDFQSALYLLYNLGWAFKALLLIVTVLCPLVMASVARTAAHVLPYYAVCAAVWWYFLDAYQKARVLYCLLRPGLYGIVLWAECRLALCCAAYLGPPGSRWRILASSAIVLHAFVVAFMMALYIATTDARLNFLEQILSEAFDDLYIGTSRWLATHS